MTTSHIQTRIAELKQEIEQHLLEDAPPSHTPGPWTATQHNTETNMSRILLGNDWLMSIRHNGEALLPTQVADAKLIAAAPDLLACLLDVLDADGDLDAMDFDRYRAAIAKATQ